MPAGGARRWGFHQLSDRYAHQLVTAAGVRPGDLVLDIGAGTGALAAPLAAAGGRVVAIELHPARLAALRDRFDTDSARPPDRFDADSARPSDRFDIDSAPSGGRGSGRVLVVRADAADLRLPRRPFKVVANPPWAISAPILRRLVSPGSRLIRADLVLPRHIAEQWASTRAPAAGRWQRGFDARITSLVPRSAFTPAPAGRAAVLTITHRP